MALESLAQGLRRPIAAEVGQALDGQVAAREPGADKLEPRVLDLLQDGAPRRPAKGGLGLAAGAAEERDDFSCRQPGGGAFADERDGGGGMKGQSSLT